jgi:hypothetical protein
VRIRDFGWLRFNLVARRSQCGWTMITLRRWPRLEALPWNRSTKLVCAIVAITAYLLTAYWLKISYVLPIVPDADPKVAGAKFLLQRPFLRFLDSDFGVIARDDLFVSLADTADNNERSPIEIYENDKALGPAHSAHADVAKIGRGRFSHWERNKSAIFLFSSTDNTDPQTNGRAYWAVKPDIQDPPSKP